MRKSFLEILGSPSSAGARADTAFGPFWTGGQTLFDANQVPGRRSDPSSFIRTKERRRSKKDLLQEKRGKKIVCDGKIDRW